MEVAELVEVVEVVVVAWREHSNGVTHAGGAGEERCGTLRNA